jgi:hypothetical protein
MMGVAQSVYASICKDTSADRLEADHETNCVSADSQDISRSDFGHLNCTVCRSVHFTCMKNLVTVRSPVRMSCSAVVVLDR